MMPKLHGKHAALEQITSLAISTRYFPKVDCQGECAITLVTDVLSPLPGPTASSCPDTFPAAADE